jgi:hypothetical protein
VLLPHVRGGRAVLRRTSAAQALLALAPSTALQMPFDRGEAMSSLAGVVRQVPCFALDIGDNMEELAGTVDRALDEALTAGGVESETVAS